MKLESSRLNGAVNRERVKSTFISVGQLWGPSGQEKVVADAIVDQLRALAMPGATVRVDDTATIAHSDTGNVIMDIPATPDAPAGAPAIGLFFHMDRVPVRAPGVPENEPVQLVTDADGTIHSQGYRTNIGADDLAGYSEINEALHLIKENQVAHGRIVVAGLTREEMDGGGAYNIDPKNLAGLNFGYAMDGGEIPELMRGGCAITNWQAQIEGKAAHAGVEPKNGISAIQGATTAISHLGPIGYVSDTQTLNVSNIWGGSLESDGSPVYNVIPDRCTVAGEFRSMSSHDLDELTSKVTSAFAQAEKEIGVRVTLQMETEPGFFLGDDAPVVKFAQDAMRSAGVEPNTISAMGGSDATPLNLLKGVPTVLLGTGVQDEHTVQEHIQVDDLVRGSAVVASLIQKTGQAVVS